MFLEVDRASLNLKGLNLIVFRNIVLVGLEHPLSRLRRQRLESLHALTEGRKNHNYLLRKQSDKAIELRLLNFPVNQEPCRFRSMASQSAIIAVIRQPIHVETVMQTTAVKLS